jgi:hypothetical protein
MCLVILFVLGMCFQSNYLEGYGFFECWSKRYKNCWRPIDARDD